MMLKKIKFSPWTGGMFKVLKEDAVLFTKVLATNKYKDCK
jgi:hypothetical protein